MKTFIVGILFVLVATYLVLPTSIDWSIVGWTKEFITTLKGGIPLILGFVGLLGILVGFADIRDRAAIRKEEKATKQDVNQNSAS